MNYEDRIKELENQIKEKDEKIAQLEKIADAYNKLTDVFNEELKEADRTLKAYESLQDVIIKEKLEVETILKAHENLEELSSLERKEAEKFLEAQEAVNKLSYEELLHKENVLRKILEINKNLSFILNTDVLLSKILKYLLESVRANRGIVFLRKANKLIPSILLNISKEEIKKDYIKTSYEKIYDTSRTRQSTLVLNVSLEGKEKLSFMCIPLLYKEKLLGIIYLDMISETDTFSESDFAIAEIFCSQASISLYNSILYSEIRRQNKTLIKLINVKTEFINKMSDNLKGPLNNILDELKSLLKSGNLPLELRNKILSSLILKVEKLSNFANKVINFVSLETSSNELFKDKVVLSDLINKILENYKTEIEEKKLNVSIAISEEVEKIDGNNTIFKTIFDELISNAIFYNKNEGMLTIRATMSGEKYKFEIIDTGNGIRKEDRDKVFEQFYRGVDSYSLNQKGAGLGLYMVRNLVNTYGGNISMQSEVGEGTKFTITIPAY